jgi:hypothetical protein
MKRMIANFKRTHYQKGSSPTPEGFGDNFFVYEIALQGTFAENAFNHLRQASEGEPTDVGLLAIAHSVLVFAGNVAKLLAKPKRGLAESRERRASRLQTILECNENEFSEIVLARNYVEHFDERMHRFLDEHHNGILLHRIVGSSPLARVKLDDGREMDARCLQHLNTHTLELTMYGETIRLSDVVEQTQKLRFKAEAWMAEQRNLG